MSKPVLRLAGDPDDIKGGEEEGGVSFTRLEVATAVTLCVGIIQVQWLSVHTGPYLTDLDPYLRDLGPYLRNLGPYSRDLGPNEETLGNGGGSY